jgi:predicted ArsR family transcriptional regulator
VEIDELPKVRHSPAPEVAVVAASDRPESAVSGQESEERTRDRVCQEILEQGPVSAGQLARTLRLTAAGIRRHLDVLLEQGLVAVWQPSAQAVRGRGRPARLFVLTDPGHAAMATGYDDLAAQALRYLSVVGGPEAVLRFARQRLADLELRYRPVVDAAGPDPLLRAEALAAALSRDGFAASTRALVGAGADPAATIGTQLCQGHCPVQHVAREFPQLCEAETDSFSRLLGVHVQRLATLAHGEHVCTTHVPGGHVPGPAALTVGRRAVQTPRTVHPAPTVRSTERPDER